MNNKDGPKKKGPVDGVASVDADPTERPSGNLHRGRQNCNTNRRGIKADDLNLINDGDHLPLDKPYRGKKPEAILELSEDECRSLKLKPFQPLVEEQRDYVCGLRDPYAMAVWQYVVRHTWGFGNYIHPKPFPPDFIANGRKLKGGERMDNGAGMGKTAAKDALKACVDYGLLLEFERIDTNKKCAKSYLPAYRGMSYRIVTSRYAMSERCQRALRELRGQKS
jgi:hypothetical protein